MQTEFQFKQTILTFWSKFAQKGYSTISYKNCDTFAPCPHIQCWLQVCLLIPDHHCLAQFLQTSPPSGTTLNQEEGRILGIFEQVKHSFKTFS